ncbi:hypothetical protein BABINDRAFT_9258 [Babjeviella inositovora NRRL Y-12698]|uniref:Uncharacterized protein n=1 Tax=Babjeviella inositovora NRRL Y-12698 TaxID=984486 RepID=A0A1E3QLI5_9ASCO|nr:uncharacterized protein BABINDRAFT_9258 [Babjeviella inositovora NRRL Y-12698]ODQ78478.1 hypothetical protein BABINDRAFT_9258 [Babjeviella inositovora NRRL Y-12698]
MSNNNNQIPGINPDNGPALPRGPPGREFNAIDIINTRGFDHLMKLYEVDRRLTMRNRQDIIDFYTSLSKSTLSYGWGAFFALGSIPFVLRYRRTGSTRGARAGLGIIGGMLGMMAGSNYGLRRGYSTGFHALEQDSSKQPVVEMIKLMSPMEAPMWMRYFQETAKDETKVMPDPRVVVQQLKEQGIEIKPGFLGRTRDPLGIHPRRPASVCRDQSSTAQPSIATQVSEMDNDPFAEAEPAKPTLSPWEAVRVRNGLARYDRAVPVSAQQPYADSSDAQTSFDQLMEKERGYSEPDASKDDGDKWA